MANLIFSNVDEDHILVDHVTIVRMLEEWDRQYKPLLAEHTELAWRLTQKHNEVINSLYDQYVQVQDHLVELALVVRERMYPAKKTGVPRSMIAEELYQTLRPFGFKGTAYRMYGPAGVTLTYVWDKADRLDDYGISTVAKMPKRIPMGDGQPYDLLIMLHTPEGVAFEIEGSRIQSVAGHEVDNDLALARMAVSAYQMHKEKMLELASMADGSVLAKMNDTLEIYKREVSADLVKRYRDDLEKLRRQLRDLIFDMRDKAADDKAARRRKPEPAEATPEVKLSPRTFAVATLVLIACFAIMAWLLR